MGFSSNFLVPSLFYDWTDPLFSSSPTSWSKWKGWADTKDGGGISSHACTPHQSAEKLTIRQQDLYNRRPRDGRCRRNCILPHCAVAGRMHFLTSRRESAPPPSPRGRPRSRDHEPSDNARFHHYFVRLENLGWVRNTLPSTTPTAQEPPKASRSGNINSMLAYFGADHSASAIVSFQPTILRQLGYTASAAQIHTIPVFLTAFVLSIAAAALSDRLRHRYAFALAGILLACIGWSLQLAQANPVGARYFGLFAITAGTYVLMPVLVVWNINNLGVGYKRVIGSAFQIGGGNCAAL
ncbi:MAG: hypothetical protein LQ352_008364, partial [Teloschistes flavicans]